MRKKVLLDLERLRYPNSGIANVFRNLACGLQELPDRPSMTLFVPEIFERFKSDSFDQKIVHPVYKFFSYFTRKFSIVHVSHQLSSYFHVKYFPQKKIVTLHDLNFLYENLDEKTRKKRIRRVAKNIRNADVIVCISNFVKEDLLKNQDLFRFKELPKIEVVYNGLNFEEFETLNRIEKFSFLANKQYILNIGVIFPKKNQLHLVEMLPFIEEDLVLVTSGVKQSYYDRIQKEIEKLGVQDRVHIFRNVTEEEKLFLLKNCTVMCHPSSAEGFGIPPIEAMYFKKPVFLNRATSLPEIGGDIAFYFDVLEVSNMVSVYKEGIRKYQADMEQMELRLKRRAEQFSHIKMAEGYVNIYLSLLR